MGRKPSAYILDSWSVMAYLEDEPAGEVVELIIAEAHDNNISLLMSIINVGEVWYTVARRMTENDADEAVATLKQLGIDFHEPDWKLTRQAATYKSQHKMSFADCFAAALTAQYKGSSLLTGDKEFHSVEKEIDIVWLKNK